MTIDQGAGHEPLPGAGGARGRHAGRRRARIFPALGADPDAGAAGGRRGMARRRRRPRSIAGAPAACCCSSCPRRRSGRGRPICIRAMRRKASSAHTVEEDDAWVEGQSLIATVEDVELIDPDLSGERLLYRLFHERGVRVFPPLPLRAQCSCSRDAVSAMLKSFAPERPRRHGQGRQGGRDLRVLLVGLPVHAARSGRGAGVGLEPPGKYFRISEILLDA